MDTRILDTLNQATSFDLYELSAAIDRILTDPVRILDIRKRMHLGQQVQFFSGRHGEPVPGIIVELRPKQVVIEEVATRQRWLLQYAAIAVDSGIQAPVTPPPVSPKIDRSNFSVGDTVGFTDKHLRQRVGTIVRLNDKTASLDCDGESWRVSWRILRKIIDL
jgi:hypothetical protein